MKYVFQIAIIFGVSFAGELLHTLLPLPIPASVYGLVLLLLLLMTKTIRLEQVEEVSEYLMSVMPLFFIEPTVALLESFGMIKGQVTALLLASLLSFMAVLIVTGSIAQLIIRRKRKKKGERSFDGFE